MIKTNKYLDFDIEKPHAIGVLRAKTNYIPIEQFKLTLNEVESIVESENLTSMVFDKRNLDTFHQPSMEWYYVDWKSKLMNNGLNRHYKILPDNNWFKKSVEAGKNEIFSKHKDFDFSRISVTYVDSISEVIEKEKELSTSN